MRYWVNQSGNAFGAAQPVAACPDVDRLDAVHVVDLLGSGTSCLVWSSPLTRDNGRQLRYLDLSRGVDGRLPADDPRLSGHKPHLLCAIRNNLGGETRLQYAPSTKFFLADRAAGTPWTIRLPFPVHVIERTETYDYVAKTRLVSTYAYRHGYYDGPEREFRGFGMVEQTDAEMFPGERGAGLFSEPETTELHRPPVRIRTWFHTGAFLDEQTVTTQFADEYYDGDTAADSLPDSELPGGLSEREAREARRALAGQPLRSEVYADDGTAAAIHPYTVTEHRYRIVRVQPVHAERYAVFFSHLLETVGYDYECNPDDPRVGHELTLEVDAYGNALQIAAVAYGRRNLGQPRDPAEPEQQRRAVVWTVNRVTNVDARGKPYRLGAPVETRTYEVTDLPDPIGCYTYPQLAQLLTTIATKAALNATDDGQPWEIAYESPPCAPVSHPQRRLVEHVRTRYWDDELTSPLSLGDLGAQGLVYETYKIAFTPGLLAGVYDDRVNAAMLASEGGYLLEDESWWIPSGVRHYDRTGFYLPSKLVDPFGTTSSVIYDSYQLLVVASQASDTAPYDVLVIHTAQDYRLLSPWEVTDPNANRTQVAFDALGRVTASWAAGKVDVEEGDPPELPGAVFTYDPWSWQNGHGPAWAHAEIRERHSDPDSPWQRSRAWSDGSGRVAMTKTQAEPGLAWTLDPNGQPVQVDTTPAVRWVGTGRTVFDNKGNPVKQYEPYFSTACVYEDEAALVEQGVTPILHYDALGRLTRTEHPDGTQSEVIFDSWRQQSSDANYNVLGSRWYADRGSPHPAEPEPTDADRRAAWLTAQHANTPAVTHLDTLGRAFLTEADAGPLGCFKTCTELDIEGNTRSITDARGVRVLIQDVDLAGRAMHTRSPDAGERWMLFDVAGDPVRAWDSRHQAYRQTYDPLRRPVHLWVKLSRDTAELLAQLNVYGETDPEAVERNLRGEIHLAIDSTGLATTLQHDFKGNLLSARRELVSTYHTTPDWSSLANLSLSDVRTAAAALLDPEPFITTTGYDALNRPVSQVLPDSTELLRAYNEAGLLETVSARLHGAQNTTAFVTGLYYNAKGQRTRIDYANGTRTHYTYDPFTYRLTRLKTLRGPQSNPERLQDLSYTYDPAGNITAIRDDAQQTVFFAGQIVTPATRYTYDALYRLATATGREHASVRLPPYHQEPSLLPIRHPSPVRAARWAPRPRSGRRNVRLSRDSSGC